SAYSRMGHAKATIKHSIIMARTVQQGFDELLRRLAPLESEHLKAAKHKMTVFSCLKKNFDCYKLLETGSFGNGTGVRHYSDTDYFAVCRAKALPKNSAYTLTRFRDELRYTFHATEAIRVDTPAVRIEFGNYASENLEIAPTYYHGMTDTPWGSKPYYSIPDFDGSWMSVSPDAHNTYVKKHDLRLNGKLKPLIQLLKAWKYYNNADILSFYIELRTTKYAENEKYIDYPEDFKRILNHLNNNDLASMQDPMGVSGLVYACNTTAKKIAALNKVQSDLARVEKAIEANIKGNVDEAFRLWNVIFNNKYPAR
ncbi:MAG: nucleotidyltransferase, partial [Flavisolibacter sp.]